MRLPHRTARRTAAEANMTPMIDVVFLLIIFFLVSSHLARRESRLALDLPSAATGATSADDMPRLTINVQADGVVALGAEPVEENALAARLTDAVAAATAPPRVRLRCDAATPYRAVEPILSACVDAGIEDVSLAVLPNAAGERGEP